MPTPNEMFAHENKDAFPSNFFNQPWIIQCHGGNKPTTTFINPLVTNVEEKEIAEIKGKLCMGCINEWLLLWDEESKDCFFLDLNSLFKVHLPPLPREDNIMTSFTLSSSLDDPNCVIIFIGAKLDRETNTIVERFIIYCRLHDETWTKILLDEDNQRITGATCVVLERKLYAYSVDRVIVFDIASLLTGLLEIRTIEGPKLAQQPRTDMICIHLVESCRHIYLLRMYSYGMGPIINMDIHHLDLHSDEWKRVHSIGNRAFFISKMCYTTVCAPDAGVSRNCIYYVPFCSRAEERKVYKFCLDDHTMTFNATSIEQTEYERRFCWFVPIRSRGVIRDPSVLPTIVLNEENHNDVLTEERVTINSKPWDNLPMDLLETLVSHVSLVDALRLFAVCKTWNLISDSISKAKTWPWLLYQTKLDGTLKLLDPLNRNEYSINVGTPSFFGTQMLSSKDGWIIVLCDDQTLLMVDPMSKDMVKPPALEELDDGFHGITFTSVPTSPDCVVIGTYTDRWDNSTEIHVWHVGEEKWTVIYDDEIPFRFANTNPVFLDEDLYCLGETGELGVFNPVEETWTILEKLKPLYLDEDDAPFRGTEDCYLLELDGELVSAFKYNYSDYDIRIFKLDRSKMEWTRVVDIAGWTIFLDQKGSFARPSPDKRWSNKVLFTTIHIGTNKTCASYCMENKRYEIKFCDTTKPLDCVWFEPKLIST